VNACFITGATGFIGERLTIRLAEDGYKVHALVRDRKRAAHLSHPNIHLFQGDILTPQTIEPAIRNCDFAFHLAAYARVWSKDRNLPYRVNVEGTTNVLSLALKHGLKKVVFTSTGGTLEPSYGDRPVNEETPRKTPFFNAYETTKAEAEAMVKQFAGKGLGVITVNPTRVYGPGLISESNAMTAIIKKFNEGKWRIIPGDGSKIGNYVLVDDVINGHVLALEKGKPGERYIIGGENITYNEFFGKLRIITGKSHLLFHVPYAVMLTAASIQYSYSRLLSKDPLITPRWVRKYLHHWAVSSGKSIGELGYQWTPLDVGLSKTVEWLNNNFAK